MNKMGRPVTGTRKGNKYTQLSQHVLAALRDAAEKQDRTQNDIVESALIKYLKLGGK